MAQICLICELNVPLLHANAREYTISRRKNAKIFKIGLKKWRSSVTRDDLQFLRLEFWWPFLVIVIFSWPFLLIIPCVFAPVQPCSSPLSRSSEAHLCIHIYTCIRSAAFHHVGQNNCTKLLSAQCISSIGQIIKSVCVSVSQSVSQSVSESVTQNELNALQIAIFHRSSPNLQPR